MRMLLGMLRKDLGRDVRRPLGILLMLAFPVLFALMLGLAFGRQPTLPKVRLLVEDRDRGLAARALVSALAAEQVAEYFDVETVGEEGAARMERGEASALLRIPEGFSEDLLRGTPTALELVRNPSERILPEIAEQLAQSLVEVLSTGSYVLRDELDEMSAWDLRGQQEVSDARVAALSVSFRKVMHRASRFLIPPVIRLEQLAQAEGEQDLPDSGTTSIFLFVLPGVSVFALFMLGDHVMRDILVEEKAGTLRRQLAGPLSAGTVVAGKVLHTAAVASISLVILSLAGWFVAEGGVDLAGFVVLALALVLAVTGAAALIYGLSGSERQGATFASVFYLVFAFAGGSFIEVDSLPDLVQRVAPFSPFYWANRGFRDLLLADGTLAGVLLPIGLLTALGVAGLVVGSRLLQRRLMAGA